jgi:hypothetical protein
MGKVMWAEPADKALRIRLKEREVDRQSQRLQNTLAGKIQGVREG